MIEDVDPGALASDRAWRQLETKLRPFVAKRVRDVDVDDVVQDVFLRIQRGVSSLRDDQRFGPWVYQVARNAVAEHARRAARHPLAATEAQLAARETGSGLEPWLSQAARWGPEWGPEAHDDGAVEREFADYAAVFVSMLPSPYREALTLTELEGRTQREAAEMLGISLSGMKSRVQRGRAKLREALEDCCHVALDARHRVIGFEPRPDGKLPDECC